MYKTPRHAISVVRALALAASVGASGCATDVAPDAQDDVSTSDALVTDGQTADTEAPDSQLADATPSDADPCASPGPTNAPCDVPGTMCGPVSCGTWHCQANADGGGSWIQLLCGGPLPPPELGA